MSRIKDLKNITIILQKRGGQALKKIDIDKLMKIDEQTFSVDRMMLPDIYSTFAILSAVAKGRVLEKKMELETFMAQRIKDAKSIEEFKNCKEKWRLEAGIISSKEYRELFTSYINAQKQYDLVSAIVDSLSIKKDMLMSLAADKRKEMESYGN